MNFCRRHAWSYLDACPACQIERQRRATTAARAYAYRHQAVRRQVALLVASGRATCARCGKPISPDEPWDLGHDDFDRRIYTGPEHRACNRATAGRRNESMVTKTSRDWLGGKR